LMYTAHVAHCPLQVPKDYLEKFNFTNDEGLCQAQTSYIYPNQTDKYSCRAQYTAMMNVLDDVIGNMTDLLRKRALWDNTLLVFSADNGGCLLLDESAGNNYPHRGGKYSPWEGGIRVAAFVSGGYIPEPLRGTEQDGIIHIADWYTTFATIAGVDPTDQRAAQWALPPVDGLNMWPLISGSNKTSPRAEIPVDTNTLIQGNYKLLLGTVPWSSWTGPIYPNSSSPTMNVDVNLKCTNGCLFDLVNDPTEHSDIAKANPDLVANMTARLKDLRTGFFTNKETGEDSCPPNIGTECACYAAVNYYGNFFGPYQYIDVP